MNTTPQQVAELVREFVAKARCRHSQRRAWRLAALLWPLLYYRQREQLTVAWEHWRLGEGPGELDRVGLEIRAELEKENER